MEVTSGVIGIDNIWWYLVEYVWSRVKWVASDTDLDLDLVYIGLDDNTI